MGAHVVGLGDDLQVDRAVVELVSVDVVDSFVAPQRAIEHLCSNDAMLELVSAINPDSPVAVVVDEVAAPPVAGTLTAHTIRAGARAVLTRVTARQLPPLQPKLRPAPVADEDAVGAAYALHCKRVYHFDADVRAMFAQVLP
jgi:hypothetical protein